MEESGCYTVATFVSSDQPKENARPVGDWSGVVEMGESRTQVLVFNIVYLYLKPLFNAGVLMPFSFPLFVVVHRRRGQNGGQKWNL